MPKIVDHKLRYAELGRVAGLAIAEHGHEKLTFAQIAKRAGCSIGALSYYARSKDDILLMAANYVFSDTFRRLSAARQQYRGIEALRHVLYEDLPCSATDGKTFDNLLFSLWSKTNENEDIRKAVQHGTGWVLRCFTEIIAEAKELGELPASIDPDIAAQKTLAHMDALTMKIRVTGIRPHARQQYEHVDEWIRQLTTMPPSFLNKTMSGLFVMLGLGSPALDVAQQAAQYVG